MNKNKIASCLLFFAVFFLFSFSSQAASVGDDSKAVLKLSPQLSSYSAGDSFGVGVYIDTNDQNAVGVSAYLSYDKERFEVIGIDPTNSAFNIEWERAIDVVNGKIKISRTIPTPGIKADNGLVAMINFRALSNVTPATDNLFFDFIQGSNRNSQVILNDGLGTNILSGVYNGKYTVGTGGPVTYSDGALLKGSSGEKVYLIEANKKRWISSAEIFNSYNYSWSGIVTVDQSVISGIVDGADLPMNPANIAEGALIRAVGDVDVYIVKYIGAKKFKRLILSPSVFNNYKHFKWSDIKDVERSVVDSFTTSDLVRADGDSRIFRLYPSGDTGEKRWVKTAETFGRFGLDWDAVYTINNFDRDSYTEGVILE